MAMRSRAVVNLALVAVVAGLGWLVLGGGEREPPPSGLRVAELDPEQVQHIELERASAAPIRLERHGDAWALAQPFSAPADAFRVRALLGLLEARSEHGFRAAGNDLAQYGLDPPAAVVRFDALTLGIGGSEPLSGQRYLLNAGEVHLIADRWFAQLFGDAASWVDPRPLPAQARPVAIALPDVAWRLEQGRWRRSPPDPDTSADAGVALAAAWQRARALAVRPLDRERSWNLQVRIELEGERAPLVLDLAEGENTLLLARRDLGVQYQFLARQADALLGRAQRPGS